jgi:hypothetical protein
MRMTKLLSIAIACALSLPAVAGEVQDLPVTFEYGPHYGDGRLYGLMQGTLATANSHAPSSLYCAVGDRELGEDLITCSAWDQTGRPAFCFVYAGIDSAFRKNVRAMNDASWVAVYWLPDDPQNPISGTCTDIRLSNGSPFVSSLHTPGGFGHPVVIDTAGSFMEGAISSARFGTGNERLSCEISSWAFGYIFCQARDRQNRFAQCHTYESQNPDFAAKVRAIDSASFVHIDFDPNTRVCKGIEIGKGSQYFR